MLTGTSVQKGQGRYLVTSVGIHTESGRVRALVLGLKVATGGGSRSGDDAAKKQVEAECEEEESSVLTVFWLANWGHRIIWQTAAQIFEAKRRPPHAGPPAQLR